MNARTGKLFALALGAWLLFMGARAGAQLLAPAPLRPDALMSSLTAEVLARLRADRGSDLAALVESRIVPVFDFERMTAIALGRNWRLASSAQRSELAAQFKTL